VTVWKTRVNTPDCLWLDEPGGQGCVVVRRQDGQYTVVTYGGEPDTTGAACYSAPALFPGTVLDQIYAWQHKHAEVTGEVEP